VCWYDNTPDDDFIIDKLPDVSNAYVAAGFSGHGFKFAPIIGKSMAELMVAGKSELNLHRFRLARFKLRKH
jgi:glycine/D-amino acid oxidase-like deaminating enzyme